MPGLRFSESLDEPRSVRGEHARQIIVYWDYAGGDRSYLELYAKVTGALRDGPATTYPQITISVGAPNTGQKMADDDPIELEPLK